MDKILDLLSKASTWKGIVGVVSALGIITNPELLNHIVAAGMGLVGAINLLRTEKKQS